MLELKLIHVNKGRFNQAEIFHGFSVSIACVDFMQKWYISNMFGANEKRVLQNHDSFVLYYSENN